MGYPVVLTKRNQNYYLSSRRLNGYGLNNEETLIFEDGAKTKRTEASYDGLFNRWTHMGKLSYSYNSSEGTMFNTTFNYMENALPHSDYYNTLTNSLSPDKKLITKDLTDQTYRTPSLDLYYITSLKGRQSLIFNVVGTYHGTKKYRIYSKEETANVVPSHPPQSPMYKVINTL